MRVFLAYPGGSIEMDLDPSDTILGIKTLVILLLQQYTDIQKIKLFFNDQLLDENSILSDNSIFRNSTVTMTYDESPENNVDYTPWILLVLIVPLVLLFFTKK